MVLLHRLADSATVVTGAVVGLVADAALPVPLAQQALKRDPQAVIPIEAHLLALLAG
jgi:hypothetical protein